MIGLLSLVPPLITDVLISSIIPRSELDQLTFCALGLGFAAVGMAGIQVMEGMAMLRLEASIDWKLQAAIIDRLLGCPPRCFANIRSVISSTGRLASMQRVGL